MPQSLSDNHMKLLKHQEWHFLSLLILFVVVYFCLRLDPTLLSGELYGMSTRFWFILAFTAPILHQVYVLLCWRSELLHGSMTKLFGKRAFALFKLGFAILFLSRLLTIIALALSNSSTLNINALVAYLIASTLFIPSAYLFYSVKKYFGMDRAFGIDHFHPEKYKNEPFVEKGIFRYTTNGMYIYGFFILYIPGFLLLSKAALLVALFNHIYIWAHFYFTELPDIKVIYTDDGIL